MLPRPLVISLLAIAVSAVPTNVTVDDADPSIIYSGVWTTQFSGVSNFDQTLHSSFDQAAFAFFQFNGTAIRYSTDHGLAQCVMDADSTQAITFNSSAPEFNGQQTLCTFTQLDATVTHSITIRNLEAKGVDVDAFIYTFDPDPNGSLSSTTSTLRSSTPTSHSTPTSSTTTKSSSSNNLAPIIGAAVGGVVAACLLAALFFWCRRRRRQSNSKAEYPTGTRPDVISPPPPAPYTIDFNTVMPDMSMAAPARLASTTPSQSISRMSNGTPGARSTASGGLRQSFGVQRRLSNVDKVPDTYVDFRGGVMYAGNPPTS
ncbi:hypothetical protein BT69DRAFT_757357 [Atractiella rhizophila]|nr:hypothetical protein BT69DRAFT_757357 [Atractiella rhizophila]